MKKVFPPLCVASTASNQKIATWDAPPRPEDEKNYKAFETAFNRYVDSQSVVIPKNNKKYWDTFDNRNKDDYRKHALKDASNLDLGQDPSLKLMQFQVSWNMYPVLLFIYY